MYSRLKGIESYLGVGHGRGGVCGGGAGGGEGGIVEGEGQSRGRNAQDKMVQRHAESCSQIH